MLQLRNVTHHYGVSPVLRDFDLAIEMGKAVAIIGPNGMGKTTILRLLAGILSPLRGEVVIDGMLRRSSIETEQQIRERLFFLADDPWMPASESARAYVMAVAKLYGQDPVNSLDHAQKLFELFNLDQKADSKISSLSTGQKKKVALCAALATQAEILLLDEPFSGGLDPAGIVALKHLMKRLADDQSRTVIFATPVPEILEEVADQVIIVRDGETVDQGTPEELCRRANADNLEQALEGLLHSETMSRISEYFGSA